MNKLRNIKIGDKVIVGKGGSSDRIAEVGFVSDTQIQVNGLRYNILDGRLVGRKKVKKTELHLLLIKRLNVSDEMNVN